MLLDELTYYREKEDYKGEIHFSALPKKFKGKFEAKARVARAWMEAYENVLHEMAYFSALAVYRAVLLLNIIVLAKSFTNIIVLQQWYLKQELHGIWYRKIMIL
ncbi:hypothetical protein [Thermoanaerobacter thermocopriae]|uniref:hypothetical protein n=1 Tax=Thermoanaerobacter thermocopriae TaxID=29350 RepID=UPI00138DFFF7|nr:hypothetical protein [Thermoanaerobacter thermocopriae]